jgi:hypothetical protein
LKQAQDENYFESSPTNELNDWQKMLMEKQREVIKWCADNKVVISPDLMELWDQAMTLGEEQGKNIYQEFLNKWKEFQKKSTKVPEQPEPTEWQKNLLLKQQEIIEIAKVNNFTIPREITDLWEQAINAGEEKGNDTYKKFLKKWTEYEKNQLKREDEYIDNPNDNGTYLWPVINDERYNTPYGQWHVDPNWNPGAYNQRYPYQPQYQDYYPNYQYPYKEPYPPHYQGQYPSQGQVPYQGYQSYQDPYQYQMPHQGGNPYTMPYQGQPGYNMEPFAGQQLNEWQNALLKVRKEILAWIEDNHTSVSGDLILAWEDAMTESTQDAYNKFMQVWEEFRSEAPVYLSKDVVGTVDNTDDRAWEYAVMNEIQGQNIIALMLGLNLVSEINDLRDQMINVDPRRLIDSIMDTWDRINLEVRRNAQ